jgi:hypothetical protein
MQILNQIIIFYLRFSLRNCVPCSIPNATQGNVYLKIKVISSLATLTQQQASACLQLAFGLSFFFCELIPNPPFPKVESGAGISNIYASLRAHLFQVKNCDAGRMGCQTCQVSSKLIIRLRN